MKTKTLAIIFIVLIGIPTVAVVAGGVILGTRVWDPLWNPFRPDPEQVIENMYENMKEVKSFYSEMLFKADDDKNNSFSVKVSNDMDNSEPKKSKGEVKISSTGEGMNISFSIQYIVNDKELFVKIGNIPPIMGMDFSFFSGQWIRLERRTVEQNQNFDFVSKIKEVLIFNKELKDEKVNGIETYHYVMKLNKDKLEEIITGLMSTAPEDIAPVLQGEDIGKQLEAIEDFGIDYFIGKKNEILYKAGFYKELEDNGEKRYLTFEWTFSDFNKNVEIEIPEDAKPIEELIEELMGGLLRGKTSVMPAQEININISK